MTNSPLLITATCYFQDVKSGYGFAANWPAFLDPLIVDGPIHSLETSGQLVSPPVCIHSHHPEEESVLRVEEILQIDSLMCLPIP